MKKYGYINKQNNYEETGNKQTMKYIRKQNPPHAQIQRDTFLDFDTCIYTYRKQRKPHIQRHENPDTKLTHRLNI